MKLNHFFKSIENLEVALDLNDKNLVWNGFNIWPIVREILFEYLRSDENGITRNTCFEYNRLKWASQYIKNKINTIRNTDILFFSQNRENREWYGHKRYNPFIDTLIETFNHEYTCAKIEVRQPLDCIQHNFFYPPVFIDIERIPQPVVDEEGTFKEKFKPIQRLILKEFGIDLDSNAILHRLLIVKEYTGFFYELLELIQPKAVFFVCCKALPMKGLILACKSLGISTVDIQHGFQGRTNVAYHHWHRWPSGGYEVLPTAFWVWGDTFAENISKWLSSFDHIPKVIIGGNVWLGKWKSNEILENEKQLRLIQEKKRNRKLILVSAKNLDSELISAMQALPKDWLWLIRSHPNFIQFDFEKFQKILEKNNIQNYEIEFPSSASLYMLLKYCDIHVTFGSTVAFEAMFFGKTTIFTDHEGYDIFSDLHDFNFFLFAEKKEDICKHLLTSLNKSMRATDFIDYIKINKKSALHGISEIMHARSYEVPNMEC